MDFGIDFGTLITLVGGGLGGLLRFVPAAIKLFSDKKDNDHEYRMTQLQLKIDTARADREIDKVHAQGDLAEIIGGMEAYGEAIRAQGKLTGVRWVDALNQSVRPILTYWWQILFTVYKLCVIGAAIVNWTTFDAFVGSLWTMQDWGIISMILGFWFVDRSLRKDSGR